MFRHCCWVLIEWFGFREKIFSISKVFGCLFWLFSLVEAFRFRSPRPSECIETGSDVYSSCRFRGSIPFVSFNTLQPNSHNFGLFCRQLCNKPFQKSTGILAPPTFRPASFPSHSSTYIVYKSPKNYELKREWQFYARTTLCGWHFGPSCRCCTNLKKTKWRWEWQGFLIVYSLWKRCLMCWIWCAYAQC